MIVNRKTVDPADPSSPAVVQLETAMGAAIDVFDGAQALHVPRRRFAPVKTTDDLLVLRSDAYVLTDAAEVVLAPRRTEQGAGPPVAVLDPEHFKLLAGFEERFAGGPPSLVEAERLEVRGDVAFGRGVIVRGRVTIAHGGPGRLRIDDATVLTG
jgi:UTP--glucose-1-phosphate uridylyltransferase